MSTYYEYQRVKVKIAHRLFHMDGWKVYGYKADESDGMTDYYSPAYWNGIAEKNGYKLVVDHSSKQEERRYSVRTGAQAALDAETAAKIAKLEQMTQERGASESEEETAKKKIEILRNKTVEGTEPAYKEVVEPGHLANPPRCNWHIEKDGIIIDKGTGLLKFTSVPDITDEREKKDWQDYNNLTEEEWKAEYIRYMELHYHYYNARTEEERKQYADSRYQDAKEKYELLEKFNLLISRFNSICGGMMGNETDSYVYKEVVTTEYRTELKPVETETGEIKEGQCFIIKTAFNYGHEKGYVYRIHEHYTRTDGKKVYIAYRLGKGYKKERRGTAARGNDWSIYDSEKFMKWFNDGSLAFCDLVEVKTPYEVKKVVKDFKKAETAEAEPEEKKEAETMTEEPEVKAESISEEEATEEPTEEPETEPAEDQEEAAPDMFATFAAAYFKKKTVKVERKEAKAEPEKQEEKPEEPPKAEEPKPEQEPEQEKPYIYGYSGNNNGIFTDEERAALKYRHQVTIFVESYGRKYYNTFFTTDYCESVKLLYSVDSGRESSRLKPGSQASYSGFIYGGNVYTNSKPIFQKMKEDINQRIIELVPDEETAAEYAEGVKDYDRERINFYLEHDFTKDAQDLFYKGRKPNKNLYEAEPSDLSDLIEYIRNPQKVVEEYARRYIESFPAKVYMDLISFNRVSSIYNDIISDSRKIEHIVLKISRCVSDEKTVRINLTTGEEIKVDAGAVKRITYNGHIDSWYVSAADRDKLRKNEYNRPDDIKPEEIKEIRHGGKVLYKAA